MQKEYKKIFKKILKKMLTREIMCAKINLADDEESKK